MNLEQILPWEVLQCCDIVFLTLGTLRILGFISWMIKLPKGALCHKDMTKL